MVGVLYFHRYHPTYIVGNQARKKPSLSVFSPLPMLVMGALRCLAFRNSFL
jgi:hypothetical protein